MKRFITTGTVLIALHLLICQPSGAQTFSVEVLSVDVGGGIPFADDILSPALPPVGLNLFVTAGVADMSVSEVIRAALPWLAVLLAVLLLITYVPAISLSLPVLVGWPNAAP